MKKYDDHHMVVEKESKRTERARHINARPYKRSKYKHNNYEKDV